MILYPLQYGIGFYDATLYCMVYYDTKMCREIQFCIIQLQTADTIKFLKTINTANCEINKRLKYLKMSVFMFPSFHPFAFLF